MPPCRRGRPVDAHKTRRPTSSRTRSVMFQVRLRSSGLAAGAHPHRRKEVGFAYGRGDTSTPARKLIRRRSLGVPRRYFAGPRYWELPTKEAQFNRLPTKAAVLDGEVVARSGV